MSDGDGRRRVQLTPPPRVEPLGGPQPGPPPRGPRGGRPTRALLMAALAVIVLGGAGYLMLRGAAGSRTELGEAPARPDQRLALPPEDPAGVGSAPRRPPAPAPPALGGPASAPPLRELRSAAEVGPATPPDAPPPPRRAPEPAPEPPLPPPDPAERELAELRRLRALAAEREAAEAWGDAAAAYEAALEIEPTATFARGGLRRAKSRGELAAALDRHLSAPGRLLAEEVLEEARALLERAAAVGSPGPRHRRQMEALAELVAAAERPIAVVLVSDGETEVVVHHVGRLGRFTRRELELRPGEYTVVGRRRGYRDVRLRLEVEAGSTPQPLVVRCEEKV